MAYFLGDGICPEFPIFARAIHDAPSGPQAAYRKAHEGVRKDKEGLFGVVKGRFRILRRRSGLRSVEDGVLVAEV